MESYAIYQKATTLIRQCGTRNPEHLAHDLGIRIYEDVPFENLLGMYTFRWNHRLIFLNPRLEHYLRMMVIAHELGHDSEHRELAKKSTDGLKEFTLFQMKDNTEYEANAFASHILLDNDEVYQLAHEGYDVVQIAKLMNSDINLMLIKLQEMNKLGYNFNVPMNPDSRFFRKIHT